MREWEGGGQGSQSSLATPPPTHTHTTGRALTLWSARRAAGVAQRGDVRGLGCNVRAWVAPAQRLHLVQADDTAAGARGRLRQPAAGVTPHDLQGGRGVKGSLSG